MNSLIKKVIATVIVIIGVTDIVNAQVVISTPSLGFSQACASPEFNDYNVSFTFSASNGLASSNQFILELSDSEGNFDNAEVIFTSAAGEIQASPATINFELPVTASGEAYKLRIKSTSPVATSAPSQSFPAYFKSQDSPFTINNLIDTGVFCSGGSYLLTIDNPGGPLNDSPLQYPNLTFNWFKETSSTTSIFISSGESLSVEQAGTYFVETNYGSCTSNSFSNRVTIVESGNSNAFEISSSLGNPFCAADGATVLSAINGENYQWFKDGELMDGETEQTVQISESGEYSVNVNLGDCSADSSIFIEASGFNANLDIDEVVMLEEDESLWVTVSTDAINPLFEWFLNGVAIPNETSNVLEVLQAGSYSVTVVQTEDCQAITELSFMVSEAFPDVESIPNLISPNNDGINDTWVIPQVYTSGTNTDIKILSSTGKLVFQTNDYLNNWPMEGIEFSNVNPVFYYIISPINQSPKKGTITVIK